MVDVALPGRSVMVAAAAERSAVLRRLRLGDAGFRQLTRAAAIVVLILLSGDHHLADPSVRCRRSAPSGSASFTTEVWNPVTEKFGALAPIYGTLVTSLIAMVIAVPVGLMIAMFLTELCPMWLRRPIGIAIELLAGIPSIIYGIWGLFVFAPFLQQTLQPFLIDGVRQCSGSIHAVRRPALRHRHADRRPDPGDHGAAVHHLDFARRVRRGAAGAQGGGLWPRLHHLGGGALRRAALYPRRRHRRRDARPRPRARRDHGGDLRDRQRAPDFELRCWRPAPPFRPPSPTNSPRRSATSTPRR